MEFRKSEKEAKSQRSQDSGIFFRSAKFQFQVPQACKGPPLFLSRCSQGAQQQKEKQKKSKQFAWPVKVLKILQDLQDSDNFFRFAKFQL